MIASFRGRLADDAPDRTVIDVGGIGYRVTCSQQTLTRLRARPDDDALRVHTYVRERAPREQLMEIVSKAVSHQSPKEQPPRSIRISE